MTEKEKFDRFKRNCNILSLTVLVVGFTYLFINFLL